MKPKAKPSSNRNTSSKNKSAKEVKKLASRTNNYPVIVEEVIKKKRS